MGQKAPNNNVDLGGQAAQAQAQLALQQQQYEAEQAATNQAAQVNQSLAQKDTNQTLQQTQAQQAAADAYNQTQGAGANATGGPAGIKAAQTLMGSTDGLSPADQKLQAAGIAASPTSLASLMQKRAANSSALQPAGSLLTSSNVKLGGS